MLATLVLEKVMLKYWEYLKYYSKASNTIVAIAARILIIVNSSSSSSRRRSREW